MRIAHLQVRHDCPFSNPVVDAPGNRVTHLCHRGREAVLELHARERADLTTLSDLYAHLGGKVVYEDADPPSALVRFPDCLCCRAGKVIPTIERAGHLFLPPSVYTPQGERYQFLLQGAVPDALLTSKLPSGVSVFAVGTKPLTSLGFEDGFLVPVSTLTHGLPGRQREALVAAVLRGYYRSPRAVQATELARGMGISRQAFDALLRKAENRLASALFPYLALRGGEPVELRRSGRKE